MIMVGKTFLHSYVVVIMVIHFRAYRMEKQEWKPNNLQENEDAVAMSSREFQLERQNFAERKAFPIHFSPFLGRPL